MRLSAGATTLPSRRMLVATAVLSVHALVMLLLLRAYRPTGSEGPEDERTGVLYLLRLPQLVSAPKPAEKTRHQHLGRGLGRGTVHAMRLHELLPESPSKVTAPTRPKVDWNREAEEVVHSIGTAGGTAVRPGSGDLPASPSRKCKPQPKFAWDPQPRVAGNDRIALVVDHGMPYLRIGKRCMFSLGFFGCALGQLPEPNGHLFDDIGDENATRGAVTVDDDCSP